MARALHRVREILISDKVKTIKWQWFYNHERSNMALGGYTPKQHA